MRCSSVGAVELELDVDVGHPLQVADAGLGDLLGDEDAVGHHATGTTASTAREKAPTPEPSSTTWPWRSSSSSRAWMPATRSSGSM